MDSFFKQIHKYCSDHTTEPDSVLLDLERETHLKTMSPNMISGRAQGKLLEFFTRMLRPKTVLEIGTFTGYAAICLAKGMPEGSKLHTIEVNPELEWISKKYAEKAGLTDKIQFHLGDARQVIPTLDYKFDLIFIDAAKFDNEIYYEMVLPKLSPGGFLMIDNVLWFGKVIAAKKRKDERGISAFNEMIQNDPRVENIMIPLRDGLTLIRKID